MTSRSPLTLLSATVPTRVVLGEPLALLRHCLAARLQTAAEIVVLAEAATGPAAVEACRAHRPDLLVVDAAMPGLDGLAVARTVLHDVPGTHVLVLTERTDDPHVLATMRLGASGYLHKDMSPHQLVEMIRSVMRGERPVSPVLMSSLLDGLSAPTTTAIEPTPQPVSLLSNRELEIMQLVAQGLSNRQIAGRLHITEGTVKNHVHHALHKLKMDNRIQAAAYIVRQGLAQRRVAVM